MNQEQKGKKVLLNRRNSALVLQAIEELKRSHCKLGPSEFVNEVLEIFFQKSLKRSRKHLEKKFFDRKKYLRDLLSSAKGQDLDQSLKDYVKTLSPRKKSPSDVS